MKSRKGMIIMKRKHLVAVIELVIIIGLLILAIV